MERNDLDIFLKVDFGSRLYGTHTKNSDVDYFGIYIPKPKDLLFGRYKDTVNFSTSGNERKNTYLDIDEKYRALPSYVKDLMDGRINAVEILHANTENVHIGSLNWCILQKYRKVFYDLFIHNMTRAVKSIYLSCKDYNGVIPDKYKKNIQNALRFSYQIKCLYVNDDLVYPLRESIYLRRVKEGVYNYKNNVIPELAQAYRDVERFNKINKDRFKASESELEYVEDLIYDILKLSLP